jgi:hypothetical protein
VETEQITALVELIEQKCLQVPEVLGTELGTAIKDRFPGLSLKNEAGGVRKFIQEYCASKVVYVRPKGGDGVYAHVSKLDGTAPLQPKRTPFAWAVLVDPNVPAQLAVDPASGALSVYTTGEHAPEAFLQVQKISLAEHRAIAEGFLPSIPDSARSPFEAALADKAFWLKWTTAFRGLVDRSIQISWMQWRQDRIILLFEERLRTGKLSDDAISNAVVELKKSKQAKGASNSPATPTAIRTTAPIAVRTAVHSPDPQLRVLAHSALDLMSEAEIRRIWLPLGSVFDAFRRIS